MDSQLTYLDAGDLLACAVVGGPPVRQRVEHELDRRAARALVRRILARNDRPAETPAELATAGAPAAA